MNVKDLTLKYGILPQRVKAVVFQRHIYWNEVYPKLGETHLRLGLEREYFYAIDFPFIDYGLDLQAMAEMEKGIQMLKVKRSSTDADPPEELKKKIEEKMMKFSTKKRDIIPEKLIGKGGGGYVLKNLVIHKGLGAPIVSKEFREAVRLTGSKLEHQLQQYRYDRMKAGGPRYAAMRRRMRK